MLISMHSILGLVSFCMNYCINAAWHGGNEPVALLRCNESPGYFDSGLQVICIVGSGVSHLPLDNTPYILYGVQVRRVCWPIKHSDTMVIEPAFGSFGTVGSCQVLLENEISISIKLVSRRKHEVLYNVLVDGCWLWTSENTVNQHQQMTWQLKSSLTVETSHWTSINMDSVPLHSSSRLWDLDFQIKRKIYFHLKRGLWTTEQQPVLFLHSPGKMLLMMFLFQKWLGSPFPEDVWAWWLLMHWLQLQFTPYEALPSVWIGFAWQYSQVCGHPCCLCTFFYLSSCFQSTFHLICFDTALLDQPPLSVMTLCDLPSLWRVSIIIFWTIAKSAVVPIIVVSKNKRYPECILYGWSFIETQSKYSNILRYWFLTFISYKL